MPTATPARLRHLGALLVGLLGVLVLGGWLVGSAVEAVTGAGDRTRLDGPVTRAIVERPADGLTTMFRAVTILGDRPILVPLVLVVGLTLRVRRRSWAPLAFLAIAQLGSIVLYNAVKALVARPRSTIGPVVASATGYWFPWAHATQTVAVWGALAVLAVRSLADRRARGAVAGAAAAVVRPALRLGGGARRPSPPGWPKGSRRPGLLPTRYVKGTDRVSPGCGWANGRGKSRCRAASGASSC